MSEYMLARLALAFFSGATAGCFLVRSILNDEPDWRPRYLLKNYGLGALFLAASALAGIIGHSLGWN